MTTDFAISTWGRHYLVTAQSTRAVAWLADHWRVPGEPPAARSTRVGRLLYEITYWWDNYPPRFTYTVTPTARKGLLSEKRILE